MAHEAGRGAVEARTRARARDVGAREAGRDELGVGRERLEGADVLGDADARELVAQHLRGGGGGGGRRRAAAGQRPRGGGRGCARRAPI